MVFWRTVWPIIFVAAISSCSPETAARFDSVRWRDADLSTRERAHMVRDLLRRHELVGMSSAQVRGLLGPPTGTEKQWQLVYNLGPDGSMFPIDNEWLLIRLHERDGVTKYVVRSD